MVRTTIVIPQRGNERLTKTLIDGIWKHEGDENNWITVVDDGYSDGSGECPAVYMNNHFHNKEGAGLTAAWNLGMTSYEEMKLQRSLWAMPHKDIGPTYIIMNNDIVCNGKFIDLCKPQSEFEIVGVKKRKEPLYGDRKLLQGWFLCFNRSLWEKLGGFDERFKLYFQDTDFQIRALKEGGSLRQVDLPLRHLGHKTAHNKKLCPDRGKILAADKAAFKEKHGL